MARSRSRQGRKQFSETDWAAEVERQKAAAAERRAAQAAPAPAAAAPKVPGKPGTPAHFTNGTLEHGPAPAPAAPHAAPSVPAGHRHSKPPLINRTTEGTLVRVPKFGSKGKLAVAALGGAAVGSGSTYALLRHNQRKQSAMSKRMLNPFEEVVVFGKAYPVVEPVPRAVTIRALVPTGGHVGHGNDLTVIRRKGKGGRRPGLEHYSKGAGFLDAGKYKRSEKLLTSAIFGRNSDKVVTASGSAARKNRAQVQNGLAMVNNPKVGNVSRVAPQKFSAPTPRINGNIPTGNRRGSAL